MKFLGFGFLFLIAAAFLTVIVVGTAFKLVGLLLMAALVVGAVTFVMRKVRGSKRGGAIDHIDAERLPR